MEHLLLSIVDMDVEDNAPPPDQAALLVAHQLTAQKAKKLFSSELWGTVTLPSFSLRCLR